MGPIEDSLGYLSVLTPFALGRSLLHFVPVDSQARFHSAHDLLIASHKTTLTKPRRRNPAVSNGPGARRLPMNRGRENGEWEMGRPVDSPSTCHDFREPRRS